MTPNGQIANPLDKAANREPFVERPHRSQRKLCPHVKLPSPRAPQSLAQSIPHATVGPNNRPEPQMKPLILAAALATASTTAHADQTYTPAPQAVLEATAGEATMDRVFPYMILAGVTVFMIFAGN